MVLLYNQIRDGKGTWFLLHMERDIDFVRHDGVLFCNQLAKIQHQAGLNNNAYADPAIFVGKRVQADFQKSCHPAIDIYYAGGTIDFTADGS
jgi:hypothetical protein